MKISAKWKRMAEIYKSFSYMDGGEYHDLATEEHKKIWDEYNSYRDYSDEAMEEAYRRESFGEPFDIRRENGKINGYIEGKQWMDLTITEYWLPDLENREIFIFELYADFPEWFLNKVLPEKWRKKWEHTTLNATKNTNTQKN